MLRLYSHKRWSGTLLNFGLFPFIWHPHFHSFLDSPFLIFLTHCPLGPSGMQEANRLSTQLGFCLIFNKLLFCNVLTVLFALSPSFAPICLNLWSWKYCDIKPNCQDTYGELSTSGLHMRCTASLEIIDLWRWNRYCTVILKTELQRGQPFLSIHQKVLKQKDHGWTRYYTIPP